MADFIFHSNFFFHLKWIRRTLKPGHDKLPIKTPIIINYDIKYV